MYYIDTPTKKVVEYKYNNETGDITNPRDAILIPDSLGSPDGSTLDSEGMLWIAMWGGSCVTRWNPTTGELLDKIDIPAKNVTSIAFGGKNLDVMYITSAKIYLDESDIEKYPLSGRLFTLKSKYKGIPCNYFGANY
jgi:sugar lactone lactonase YvrE